MSSEPKLMMEREGIRIFLAGPEQPVEGFDHKGSVSSVGIRAFINMPGDVPRCVGPYFIIASLEKQAIYLMDRQRAYAEYELDAIISAVVCHWQCLGGDIALVGTKALLERVKEGRA